MSRGTEFVQRLKEEILIGDGANGSRLFELGCSPEKGAEIHNLTSPDLVTRIHSEYIEAGADLIETNTFAANRLSLERYGLAEKTRAINEAGVRLALDAADDAVCISGSVGPIGTENSAELYKEQVIVLADSGVHLIHLETFTDLEELVLAVTAAKEICGRDIPVIAQMVFTEGGQVVSGQDADEAAFKLREAGADIIGINCGRGVGVTVTAASRLVPAAGDIPVSTYPNAGYPESVDGRFVYMATPAYMADNAVRLAKLGVRLIGGCCGTNPDTVRAVHRGVSSIKKRKAPAKTAAKINSAMTARFKPGKMLESFPAKLPVIAEIDPPGDLLYEPVLDHMVQVADAGADAVSMAENPLARLKMCNITLAGKFIEKTGRHALCHMTCRDRNILGLQSALMGAHITGVRGILAVSGDPVQRHAREGTGQSVYNLNSIGLIRMLSSMNRGMSSTGRDLKAVTEFSIGCAFNTHTRNREGEINRFKMKISEGAQFTMTQPVFDKETAERVREETDFPRLRLFTGFFPLISLRTALYLHNEVPGISIPEGVLELLSGYDSPVEQKKAGMDFMRELIGDCVPFLDGVYLIAPHRNPLALVPLIHQVTSMRSAL